MKLSKAILPNIFLATTLTFTSTAILAEPNKVNEVGEVKTSQIAPKTVSQAEIVNLNKSTLSELITLKGVGEKKAQAILIYRKLSGGFKAVDELKEVKGIGSKVIDDNKLRLKI